MAFNRFEWRTTKDTLMEFYYLLDELNTFSDGTDEYSTILEQIRILPGFPPETDEDDYIEIITTDVTVH